MIRPLKIISGGQTGADRAGLEAARFLGIETGGYCPRDCRTERGPDPSLLDFGLLPTASQSYTQRTILNIKVADATVVFGELDSPGAKLTIDNVARMGKLLLKNPTAAELQLWVESNQVKVLNVAGNRESRNPGIFQSVYQTLVEAFS
jgi:hypothetical protein